MLHHHHVILQPLGVPAGIFFTSRLRRVSSCETRRSRRATPKQAPLKPGVAQLRARPSQTVCYRDDDTNGAARFISRLGRCRPQGTRQTRTMTPPASCCQRKPCFLHSASSTSCLVFLRVIIPIGRRHARTGLPRHVQENPESLVAPGLPTRISRLCQSLFGHATGGAIPPPTGSLQSLANVLRRACPAWTFTSQRRQERRPRGSGVPTLAR